MLYNDKELFEQVVLQTSQSLGIEASIVEKDYFVTLFLKEISINYKKSEIYLEYYKQGEFVEHGTMRF